MDDDIQLELEQALVYRAELVQLKHKCDITSHRLEIALVKIEQLAHFLDIYKKYIAHKRTIIQQYIKLLWKNEK